jgi:septum formation protein
MDELAAQLGFSYSTVAAGIDEKLIRDDDPEELVMRLAHAKAMAIAERWKEKDAVPSEGLLITCDQVVVCDGVVLEKPENEEQARQYIRGYSNSSAQTVGAVRVSNLATGRATASTDCCEVQFGSIPDEVVDQLVAEEATYSCAGGLMVEHPLVAPLITAQFGEQASIMGLPKGLTLELLHKAALMGQPRRTVK